MTARVVFFDARKAFDHECDEKGVRQDYYSDGVASTASFFFHATRRVPTQLRLGTRAVETERPLGTTKRLWDDSTWD